MGKIILKSPNGDIELNLSYIIEDMRRVARSNKNRRSVYCQMLRMWASELEHRGIGAVKHIQECTKTFWGCSEKWMVQDCKVWHNWLNMIRMMQSNKPEPKLKKYVDDQAKYETNYEKIFTAA